MERFSFYGMQGILLIYLYYSAAQGGLGIDARASPPASSAPTRCGLPLHDPRAWLADRLIGPERTLFYSAIAVMAATSPSPCCPA